MRYWFLTFALVLMVGCDGGSGGGVGEDVGEDVGGGDVAGGEDSTVSPDGVGDVTPPEFRDVRVDIYSAPSIQLDLNNQDVTRVLPMAFPATFTVLTTDDTSTQDAITVTVLLGEGDTPVGGQTPAFSNGLWKVEVPEVAPGETYRVRVEDEAGNGDIWIHTLTIPTLDEAVAGDWDTRWYDAEGTFSHSWNATWSDGTWVETRVDPAGQFGGTWTIDGDLLTVETTTSDPGDGDPATVERRDQSGFYVDETYFAAWPLERVGEGVGIEGTWTRSGIKVWQDSGEGLHLDEDETHTLVFAEGGALTLTLEGIIDGVEDQTQVITGTWVLVPNENYIENYGDYLVITLDTLDGAPLDEPNSWVDLMVIRHDLLLLSPKVRAF